MPSLYVFDNGPPVARVLQRPVLRLLRDAGFELRIACNRDDGYLFADLLGANVSLAPCKLPASPRGALIDLAAFCPAGWVPLDMNSRRYRDTRAPQWWSVATSVNRQMREQGIEFAIDPESPVPMLDFAASMPPVTLPRPTVYVDTRGDYDAQAHFVFDWPRLIALLPGHDFWCADGVPFAHTRLIDGSGFDLVQQSLLSERCVVLLGKAWPTFALTLTEANRWKPKALCGHDRHSYMTFWDYPSNPLEYLATMEQLADFLRSNASAVEARRVHAASA